MNLQELDNSECEHEFEFEDGHPFCINCGIEGDPGEYIDYLEYIYADR